ncbi:hypothetical protein [Paenibacillus sp. UNC451MF]|uniref:hypothetical protein n=1 Tax=Paenibacillus sp. UNC451MF TaxID=1449063 RepID=UPI00048B27A6|nr:hypothetical protein [Paenibacillus sp. UNC451MF]
MEKKLVKGGVYGFIIGLFLAILFCADRVTLHVSASSTTIELLTMRDYVLKLLRCACGFSLGTVAVLWLQDWMKRDPRDNQEQSFAVGFLKAFFIVLGVIIAVTLLMLLWRRFT